MSLVDIRQQIPQWADDHGFTGTFKNGHTGWKNINLTPNNIKDSVWHGTTVEKIKAVPALPQLIENGTYLVTDWARDEKQQGMKSHFFAGKIKIGETSKVAGFIIKEDARGKKFFDHEMLEIADLDESWVDSGATPVGEKVTGSRQGHVVSILRRHLNVNNSMDKISTLDVAWKYLSVRIA